MSAYHLMKTSNNQLISILECVLVNNSNSNARASFLSTNRTTSLSTREMKPSPTAVSTLTRVACWITRIITRMKSRRCSRTCRSSSSQSKKSWPSKARTRIPQEEMTAVWRHQEIVLAKLETVMPSTRKALVRFMSIATVKQLILNKMNLQVQVQLRAYEISFRWFQGERSLNQLMNCCAILEKHKTILMRHLKS